MGIPHLTSFLQPYAELNSLAGRDAVIDGPGLAYHIHHLCMSSKASDRKPSVESLSYAEIGNATIKWLDSLQAGGVSIKKVYFDGFLPASKLHVRLERLRSQTRRLSDYYEAHAVLYRTWDSFSPALLVPAVMDALKQHQTYKRLLIVVPGEADPYCAGHIQKCGGIVFTGDSDLLVYDLGGNGSVCFFKDLDMLPKTDSGILSCHIYSPSRIADRLALPKSHGLRILAFEVLLDCHATFPKLLKQAVSLSAASKESYEDFCKEYLFPAVDPQNSQVSCEAGESELLQNLQHLDPRISEYVLQFPSIARAAGLEIPELESRHVFLPFLLDCPVRTSAWEMSMSVRQLACGLINLIVPDEEEMSSIFEHRKQQKNASGRELQLPTKLQISEACSALMVVIDQFNTKLPRISGHNLWVALAVYQDVEYSFSHGKPAVSDLAINRLIELGNKPHWPQNYTWDIVQFFAQIEGSYYSFRMLEQITSLLVAHGMKASLPQSVFLLRERLGRLPSLDTFESIRATYHMSLLHKIEDMSKVSREILGIKDRESIVNVHELSKRPRKKKKRTHPQSQERVAQHLPNNPFALLDTE